MLTAERSKEEHKRGEYAVNPTGYDIPKAAIDIVIYLHASTTCLHGCVHSTVLDVSVVAVHAFYIPWLIFPLAVVGQRKILSDTLRSTNSLSRDKNLGDSNIAIVQNVRTTHSGILVHSVVESGPRCLLNPQQLVLRF